MKKISFITALLICLYCIASGQGQQNVWTFGDKAGLDFSGGSPAISSNNLFPGEEGCSSICDASGQLLFYSDGYWVWDRLHHLMPSLTAGTPGYTAPITLSVGYPPLMPYTGAVATQATAIAGAPAKPGIYYLFSLTTTGQLFYSMIDMSLNGGNGDVISGKMGIFIGGGLTEKMTVANGCNNIWLITRARTANQYKAYELNDTGIITTPIVSTCGLLPLTFYKCGTIKLSPDGSRMAAACNEGSTNTGGLELYDFNAATGKVTNAAVLDSSSTLGYYYGACFSPDNSKLYASTSSFSYGGTFYPGKVRQFNVGLSITAAIIASNTLIYTDAVTLPDNIGDLKRGSDGKIYLGNGRPAPPYIPFMHCISAPNAAGTGCTFVPNAVALPAGIWPYRGLPNDVAVLPIPDTSRATIYLSACFRDSITITADTGKHYKWQDGSTARSFTVHMPGTYTVKFINASCDYEIDTYKVNFVHLPILAANGYSCTGQAQGTASVKATSGDTTAFTITWADAAGTILQQHTFKGADSITGLDTGSYTVHIHTAGGCDTSLRTRIIPVPVPLVTATADTLFCLGTIATFEAATDGYQWAWHFGDGTISTDKTVSHLYRDTGTYQATFSAKNLEGCADTVTRTISVKSFKIELSADRLLVNRGEQVILQSAAAEPYTVTAWQPADMLTNQAAYSQTIAMDTTRTFMVRGQSAYGCMDSAFVAVAVNPTVAMPSAFSPNGDGKNDHFRAVTYGSVLIRNFAIYNRWGQMVYWAYGTAAAEGWDGYFHGIPAEMGAYFYTIDMETPAGATIALKGDVTLVR